MTSAWFAGDPDNLEKFPTITPTQPATSTPPTVLPPGFDNNAFAMLTAILKEWGLDSLADSVRNMLIAGDKTEIIPFKIRETDAYKTRFAGLIQRTKNGLAPLSEAQYLATETALKSVVRKYIGSGQYDSNDTVARWLASDVSPQELNDRLSAYAQNYMQQPQSVKDAWAAHGMTPRDAIVAAMDPKVTQVELKRGLTAFALGSEALQAYKDSYDFDKNRLYQLGDAGVTADQNR